MHNDSNKNPSVLKSVLKYFGFIPNAATAIDGSTKFLFLPDLNALLDLIEGHQASISWIMNNLSKAS